MLALTDICLQPCSYGKYSFIVQRWRKMGSLQNIFFWSLSRGEFCVTPPFLRNTATVVHLQTLEIDRLNKFHLENLMELWNYEISLDPDRKQDVTFEKVLQDISTGNCY